MKFNLTVTSKLAFSACFVCVLAACATAPTKEVISTKAAPAAIGPYSQGIKFGNLLFLAGQIPIDPATNQLNTGSIEDQTKLVLENLRAVLTANGMTMDDVVSTSVFLKDLNDFARMKSMDVPTLRGLLRVHAVSSDSGNDRELARARIPRPSFYLPRPDGHVGLAGTQLDIAAVTRYVSERLTLTAS